MTHYVGILDGADDVWGVRVPDQPDVTAVAQVCRSTQVSWRQSMPKRADAASRVPPSSPAPLARRSKGTDRSRTMFIPFFLELKAARVPVSLREFLSLLEGLAAGLVDYDVEGFYYLARSALVKDERHIDRFDQVFSHIFRGVEALAGDNPVDVENIPEEWLRRLAEKHLTDEEKSWSRRWAVSKS